MRRFAHFGLVAFPLAVCAGVALGDTTVSAMQVRRGPEAAAPPQVSTAQFDLGRAWAANHRPLDGDACPQPTLLFQIGCVAATRN